ncbi:MAG: hypothetical protein BWZ10_00629 [candidate division BRC1 bacterium ADurb.BinA364]|nr:MAG: hypothetical protein BWZ10_00629 [candidate division BRC1 bacterium ADurb.BinA364]
MQEIGVDDRFQAAHQRIGARGRGQNYDRKPEQPGLAFDIPAQQFGQQQAPGIKRRGQIGRDDAQQIDQRNEFAAAGVVAAFEKLGRGVQPQAHIDIDEENSQQDEAKSPDQLKIADDQPDGEGLARLADELLRRDIGGKQRSANQRPTHFLAGQEKVVPAFHFAPGDPESQPEDGDEITRDDSNVDCGDSHASSLRRKPRSGKGVPLNWPKKNENDSQPEKQRRRAACSKT